MQREVEVSSLSAREKIDWLCLTHTHTSQKSLSHLAHTVTITNHGRRYMETLGAACRLASATTPASCHGGACDCRGNGGRCRSRDYAVCSSPPRVTSRNNKHYYHPRNDAEAAAATTTSGHGARQVCPSAET